MIRSYVEEGAYRYFQVCIDVGHDHEHTFDLHLEALSGDPDMYVSTEVARPTLASCTWISAQRGSDSLLVSTNNREFTPGSSIVYVAVYGRYAAHFSISVRLDEKAPPRMRGFAAQRAQQRSREARAAHQKRKREQA